MPQPQHEVPRRRRTEEQAVPLRSRLVRLAHLGPVVVGRQSINVRQTIEAVFLLLERLDLVLARILPLDALAARLQKLAQERLTGAAARAGARALAQRFDATFPLVDGSNELSFLDRVTV